MIPERILTPYEAERLQREAGPELYHALRRLLIAMGEGGRRGRAVDLVSLDYIEAAERAVAKAEGN